MIKNGCDLLADGTVILLYLKNDLMAGDDFLYADDDATIFYYTVYIALYL